MAMLSYIFPTDSCANMHTEFWIEQRQLKPTLLLLAYVAQYTLSIWDKDAIDMGLSNTDVWQKQYYDCAYTGVYTLRLALALDEAGSTDLVFIRIEYAAPLNALIDWVMYTAQTLHLQASQ